MEERKRETVRLKDHFNNNSVAYGEEGKETSREGAWGGGKKRRWEGRLPSWTPALSWRGKLLQSHRAETKPISVRLWIDAVS